MSRKERRIFLNELMKRTGAAVPKWQQGMFRAVAKRTTLVPVEGIASSGEFHTAGENVRSVMITPGGRKYIGNVRLLIPQETLERVRWIKSRDKTKRKEAESAMQTIAHEFSHNYFGAIDYEARKARYYYFNEGELQEKVGELINAAGKVRGEEAQRTAKKLVRREPMFWANYVAHTDHEAAADLMSENVVSNMVRGRPATNRELMEATMFRPVTVRERLKATMRGKHHIESPKKPSAFEEMARRIDVFSSGAMNLGTLWQHKNPLEAIAARKQAAHARERREAIVYEGHHAMA